MKKIILIVITMSCAVLVHAQDFVDNALIFSRTTPGGSARIRALGGTSVSLGGDFSSAYSNPAGLGMYNRSEFTFSPSLNFSNASSTYFGTTTDASKTTFTVPGIGLVLHNDYDNEEGFLGGSFAVTLNRINDFNQNYRYTGTNTNNSIVNYLLEDANGIYFNNEILDPASLERGESNYYSLPGLAFYNFLIDTLRDDNGDLYYDSPLTVYWDEEGESGSVRQMEMSERSGAQYQWSISYGANYSDKLFIGATLGITSLRFKLRQTYRESDFNFEDAESEVNSFDIEETYNIRGSGVNFGVGLIYRPVNSLQIGASIVTPTIWGITDNYEATISSDWATFDDERHSFDAPIISEYNLRTPMRLSTGATFITKVGFISADVEFINYGKSKYSTNMDENYDPENSDIKAAYESVVNYRLGGEYRFENFRARAGFSFMSDPLIDDELNRSTTGLSAGFGYRAEKFFVDFAALYSTTKGRRVPYFVQTETPEASQTFNTMSYMFTVGFPF